MNKRMREVPLGALMAAVEIMDADFDSAIPRFESWRPSQPSRSLRCDFQVWEKRLTSAPGAAGGKPDRRRARSPRQDAGRPRFRVLYGASKGGGAAGAIEKPPSAGAPAARETPQPYRLIIPAFIL